VSSRLAARRAAVIAGLLFAALVPAACGGDGAPSSGVPVGTVPPETGTPPTAPTEPTTPSTLNIVLGRPTDSSIAASVLADPGTEVYFEYGTAPATYTGQTLVEMFNADLYAVNVRNAAARQPDLYVALGDDFSIEKLIEQNSLTQEAVDQVYRYQRTYFGLLGGGSSLFLVNGNHEQAAGYLLGDRYNTPYRNAPVFAGRARVTYFPLPAPDGFYSGDTMQIPGVGLVRDYYAFEWGDALFVVIDPYWHSPVPVDNGVPGVEKTKDAWEATIGDEQYAWFKKVLETSRAKYKFVFEHHVLGTGRGAAALVHTYEWGGYNRNGTAYEFSSLRRNWAKPIHRLMEDIKVTIFFFGHDHLFTREKVDGVVYQEVPNPADNTYTAFNADAYNPATISLPGANYDATYGVIMPNSGYLDVTVSPDRVTVSYIRAVLPGDEAKAGATNGAVGYSYSVSAR